MTYGDLKILISDQIITHIDPVIDPNKPHPVKLTWFQKFINWFKKWL
jgi:hypothetical protein